MRRRSLPLGGLVHPDLNGKFARFSEFVSSLWQKRLLDPNIDRHMLGYVCLSAASVAAGFMPKGCPLRAATASSAASRRAPSSHLAWFRMLDLPRVALPDSVCAALPSCTATGHAWTRSLGRGKLQA